MRRSPADYKARLPNGYKLLAAPLLVGELNQVSSFHRVKSATGAAFTRLLQ